MSLRNWLNGSKKTEEESASTPLPDLRYQMAQSEHRIRARSYAGVVNCEDSQRIDRSIIARITFPSAPALPLSARYRDVERSVLFSGRLGKPPRQFKPKVQHSGEEACS